MAEPKYLAMDADGDWQGTVYLTGQEAVAQAIKTRLNLWLGEWFNDPGDGTPWLQKIIGRNTSYDLEIKNRLLGTNLAGVSVIKSITNYSSNVINRNLTVTCNIDTIYGPAKFNWSNIDLSGLSSGNTSNISVVFLIDTDGSILMDTDGALLYEG